MNSPTTVKGSRGFFSLGVALVVLALSGNFAVFAAKKHGEQPQPAAADVRSAKQPPGSDHARTNREADGESDQPVAEPTA
jgi:hypothetical protein